MTINGTTIKVISWDALGITFRHTRKMKPIGPNKTMIYSKFQEWITSHHPKLLTVRPDGRFVWCHKDYLFLPTHEMNL